jgi:hypothetical protein
MKIGLIISGALLAILLAVASLWLFNPPCPRQWSAISPGMTEREVNTVIRYSFDTPIGLEQTHMWETRKDFWYSRGTYHRFSGREWTLIVTYDATGLEAGLARKVVGTTISSRRLPFSSFLRDFTEWN